MCAAKSMSIKAEAPVAKWALCVRNYTFQFNKHTVTDGRPNFQGFNNLIDRNTSTQPKLITSEHTKKKQRALEKLKIITWCQK